MEPKESGNTQEIRKKNLEFYEDSIPYLKKTLEFETLTADIEEARLRKAVAMVRLAQIYKQDEPDKADTNQDKSK